MEIAIGILSGLLIAGIAWAVLGRKQALPKEKEDTQGLFLIQQQMAELTKQLDSKLTESRRDMTEAVRTQFSESQKLLREINEQMNKSLVDVAREQEDAGRSRGFEQGCRLA